MKAIFKRTDNPELKGGQLSVYTDVGEFHSEVTDEAELEDTWLGNDTYDVNVYYNEDDNNIQCVLYAVDNYTDIIDSCIVEVI